MPGTKTAIAAALGIEFDEGGWQKKVEIAKEAVDAIAVGQAVMGKYGNDPRRVAEVGGELIKIGERIKGLGTALDVKPPKEKP